MTAAICFNCGEFKFGAWTPCPKCKALPRTEDDYVLSVAMTDHFFDEAALTNIGHDIKEGRIPQFPDAFRELLLKNLRESDRGKRLAEGDP